MSRQTTLCYLEDGDRYLLLHRVKKEHDENRDKWIGVGGKFDVGRRPNLPGSAGPQHPVFLPEAGLPRRNPDRRRTERKSVEGVTAGAVRGGAALR